MGELTPMQETHIQYKPAIDKGDTLLVPRTSHVCVYSVLLNSIIRTYISKSQVNLPYTILATKV